VDERYQWLSPSHILTSQKINEKVIFTPAALKKQ
jgi:hypothetical protein